MALLLCTLMLAAASSSAFDGTDTDAETELGLRLDRSFAGDGARNLPNTTFGGSLNDGRLVYMHRTRQKRVLVLRVLRDGQLDARTGREGIVTLKLPFNLRRVDAIAPIKGGIVVTGVGDRRRLVTLRLDRKFKPLKSFSSDGFAIGERTGPMEMLDGPKPTACALRDGSIVAWDGVGLQRFTANGTIDRKWPKDWQQLDDLTFLGVTCNGQTTAAIKQTGAGEVTTIRHLSDGSTEVGVSPTIPVDDPRPGRNWYLTDVVFDRSGGFSTASVALAADSAVLISRHRASGVLDPDFGQSGMLMRDDLTQGATLAMGKSLFLAARDDDNGAWSLWRIDDTGKSVGNATNLFPRTGGLLDHIWLISADMRDRLVIDVWIDQKWELLARVGDGRLASAEPN